MQIKTDDLRAAYQALHPRAPQECPDSDTLVSLVTGEIGETDRANLLSHISICASCSQELQCALALEDQLNEAPNTTTKPGYPRNRPWAAVAAAFVVAIVSGFLWWENRNDDYGQVRGSGQVSRNDNIQPKDASELSTPPLRLSWQSTGEVELQLFDQVGTLLFEYRGEDSQVELPKTIQTQLTQPGVYYWTLTNFGEKPQTYHFIIIDTGR